jgi:hypothetical protein
MLLFGLSAVATAKDVAFDAYQPNDIAINAYQV